MEWIVNNCGTDGAVCPKSMCHTQGQCPTKYQCPKNTGICAIKFWGPTCPKRACGIFVQ